MKNIFFSILLIVTSCKDSSTPLPNSTGSFSEVVFVVEDFLWGKEIGKLVNQIFKASIKGTTQNEANYRILQVNFSEFNNIFKRQAKHKLRTEMNDFFKDNCIFNRVIFSEQSLKH